MLIPLEQTVTVSASERRPLRSPAEIMEIARARESSLSRLLIAYISSGLVFMLLPGTFLGVWNLLQISGRESAGSVSPAWLQAHGHAQVFGWIGSFIFGIGFYSIPKLRGATKPAFGAAWACWIMWTIGVAMRWTANVYGWQWRLLLPVSALLELAAFVIFFRAVSQHRPEDSWEELARAMGVGRYQREYRFDADARREFRRNHLHGGTGRKPCPAARSRPALSRAGRLGISGAVCLGIQQPSGCRSFWG